MRAGRIGWRGRAPLFVAAAVALIAASGSGWAQGAGIDCAKPATPIEGTVCGNAELVAADRAMAAAYGALLRRLDAAARRHLAADQARWSINRERACVGDPDDIEECLAGRYRDRTGLLAVFADGAYPFVSEQTLVKAGEVRGIPYSIDASYPQFDGTSVDFTAVNQQLATAVRTAASRVVPGPDADNGGGSYDGPAWRYEQAFTLHRPSDRAIAVAVAYEIYEGGADGIVGVTGTLVDLRTGRAAAPRDVFLPGDGWLRELTTLARASIKASNLADLLKDPGRYVFLDDRLELSFNQDEGGPFTLEVPYARLKALLRPDGPIPPEAASKETP